MSAHVLLQHPQDHRADRLVPKGGGGLYLPTSAGLDVGGSADERTSVPGVSCGNGCSNSPPDDTDLRRIGRDWLGGREDRPEWTFVWQPLLRHPPGDSEFRKIGRKWLSGREDHRAWGFVWQRLFALDPGDTDLRKTGREWLDGASAINCCYHALISF